MIDYGIKWHQISLHFTHRTSTECRKRYLFLIQLQSLTNMDVLYLKLNKIYKDVKALNSKNNLFTSNGESSSMISSSKKIVLKGNYSKYENKFESSKNINKKLILDDQGSKNVRVIKAKLDKIVLLHRLTMIEKRLQLEV